MPRGLQRRVLTTFSCCWEPDRNLTWWSTAEDAQVSSSRTDQPRLCPLQQACVSLFDVSGGQKSARFQNDGM